MRIVRYDTDTFLEVSERLLEEGYRVRFRAGGGSMRPAINDGDSVTVAPVDPVVVRPSNILMYRRNRRGIAHRVVHVLRAGEGVVAFLLRGDATATFDAAVAPGEILGRVVTVERGGGRAPGRWWARVPRFVRSVVSRITGRCSAALRN
jgi:hypothetical protein